MQSIHKIVKVQNNQVIINLPTGFAAHEVEVILKPSTRKSTAIRELEKEIDMGMRSPVSSKSHREIFDNLKEKYETL